MEKGRNLGPLPFKYNKSWDHNEKFSSLIQTQWEKEVVGSPNYVWETKLKNLRTVIKKWAKENAAMEKKEKADLQEQMEQRKRKQSAYN